MINTEKAFKLIKENISSEKNTVKINIKKSIGMFLAENVKSNINIPPSDNSAVDGYAINLAQYKKNRSNIYEIVSEINAGDIFRKKIKKYQCIRVSTGAHLPKHLDTVIMLEDTKLLDNNSVELPTAISEKKNVRKKGEDIKKGKVVISKKSILRAQEIGLLASINRKIVKVFKKIKVAVISNGNELVNPGNTKSNNQIYDSNRFMLMALLKLPYVTPVDCGILKDDYKKIKDKILYLRNKFDLIIISGGASVGHKDYVIKIVSDIGKLIFSKVAIKPGRPLSFGLLNNKVPILILPGNPVASFVTFNIFGIFLLNCIYASTKFEPKYFIVKSNFNMKKKMGREEFLRGKLVKKNNKLYANKFPTEGAGILSSVVWSDGLIKLNADISQIKINDHVQFYPYRFTL